ncbi:hypothetical protein ACEPAH_9478 [Sanghuangporus vaninii]
MEASKHDALGGITFKVAKHDARSYNWYSGEQIQSPRQALLRTITDSNRCIELLQSSMPDKLESFATQRNGFVHTVLDAYNHHHHLVIRPDDVWITILSQLSSYVNAHSEELRDIFVSHEGKTELQVVYERATLRSFDYSRAAIDFSLLLKGRIKDDSFYDFVIPSFSTTTRNDEVICSVMMMSTLKAYFDFTIMLLCGIPSVRLLGQKSDYVDILGRLDKLDSLGNEPRAFASMLRPVIHRFILTFNAIEAGKTPDLDFWGRICHIERNASGPDYLCGWLSAFCVWNQNGEWQASQPMPYFLRGEDELKLDYQNLEVRYPVIKTCNIPPAICEVDVKVIEVIEAEGMPDQVEYKCMMIAGHIGTDVTSSLVNKTGVMALDTVQPSSHWFMFVKGQEIEEDTEDSVDLGPNGELEEVEGSETDDSVEPIIGRIQTSVPSGTQKPE